MGIRPTYKLGGMVPSNGPKGLFRSGEERLIAWYCTHEESAVVVLSDKIFPQLWEMVLL